MTTYYVEYKTKRGKGRTEHTDLETARRDAAALKQDRAFKNIGITTGRGKKVSTRKASSPQRGIQMDPFGGMGMGFGAPPRKNDRRRPPSLFDGL